jgi:hypothetical protein
MKHNNARCGQGQNCWMLQEVYISSYIQCRESSVGTATPVEGENFFTRLDQSWGPPSLRYYGYWVFPKGEAARTWLWHPLLLWFNVTCPLQCKDKNSNAVWGFNPMWLRRILRKTSFLFLLLQECIINQQVQDTNTYYLSNKSPTRCNNFPVYYPDVCLQLNMLRAFSRPSSGAQWLRWHPLILPSYRGDSRVVFVVGPADRNMLSCKKTSG